MEKAEAFTEVEARETEPTPVVGLTVTHGSVEWLEKNNANYMRVIGRRAAHCVILAPDTPAVFPNGMTCHPDARGTLASSILEELDGLVLGGGGDVHPSEYGQELNGAEEDRIDRKRDALELSLTRAALQQKVPIFGICRGFQVLNIAAGGSLIQHVDGHRSPEDCSAYHSVTIDGSSRLAAYAGTTQLRVNTFHHQAVDLSSLAPGFLACAIAQPDSFLVEAIESVDHTWALGVQWHPERDFELDAGHSRIWDSFVAACRLRREARAG